MLIILADYIQIHQPSLTVTSGESLRLSCETQFGTKFDRKIPEIFWFKDIHNVKYFFEIYLKKTQFAFLLASINIKSN